MSEWWGEGIDLFQTLVWTAKKGGDCNFLHIFTLQKKSPSEEFGTLCLVLISISPGPVYSLLSSTFARQRSQRRPDIRCRHLHRHLENIWFNLILGKAVLGELVVHIINIWASYRLSWRRPPLQQASLQLLSLCVPSFPWDILIKHYISSSSSVTSIIIANDCNLLRPGRLIHRWVFMSKNSTLGVVQDYSAVHDDDDDDCMITLVIVEVHDYYDD